MKRNLIAIVAAVLVGIGLGSWWFTRSYQREERVAQELRRQARSREARSRKSRPTRQGGDNGEDIAARPEEAMADEIGLQKSPQGAPTNHFRLTRQLNAYIDRESQTWLVSTPELKSVVEMPFVPPSDPHEWIAKHSHRKDSSSANEDYVGVEMCKKCHQKQADGFKSTSHSKTSRLATLDNIVGPIDDQSGSLMQTPDRTLKISMESRNGTFVQNVMIKDWRCEFPMDIVTGSSKTGQTFLYWKGDHLYQAHASYIAEVKRWSQSPGFYDTELNFGRRIGRECLECHTTYAKSKPQDPNAFYPESVLFGFTCERCHGPGKQHVDYHEAYPEETEAKHLLHPGELSQERQIDLCSQCHSGMYTPIGEAFRYRPGERLADYRIPDPVNEDAGVGGVHTTNQASRLRKSKCFQATEMTCTTCHDPHEFQRSNISLFSKACQQCHPPSSCGMSEEVGDAISQDCIACHMPTSKNLDMTGESMGAINEANVQMVDHFIRIDREATEQFLETKNQEE